MLEKTTVDDARDVYAAIRQARPGGLGRVDEQDIAAEPSLTLLEVMRLAADRDGIAREYATAFEATFELGAPALERARGDGLPWEDAVVEERPHVARPGPRHAGGPAKRRRTCRRVSRRARTRLQPAVSFAVSGRRAIDEMDAGAA